MREVAHGTHSHTLAHTPWTHRAAEPAAEAQGVVNTALGFRGGLKSAPGPSPRGRPGRRETPPSPSCNTRTHGPQHSPRPLSLLPSPSGASALFGRHARDRGRRSHGVRDHYGARRCAWSLQCESGRSGVGMQRSTACWWTGSTNQTIASRCCTIGIGRMTVQTHTPAQSRDSVGWADTRWETLSGGVVPRPVDPKDGIGGWAVAGGARSGGGSPFGRHGGLGGHTPAQRRSGGGHGRLGHGCIARGSHVQCGASGGAEPGASGAGSLARVSCSPIHPGAPPDQCARTCNVPVLLPPALPIPSRGYREGSQGGWAKQAGARGGGLCVMVGPSSIYRASACAAGSVPPRKLAAGSSSTNGDAGGGCRAPAQLRSITPYPCPRAEGAVGACGAPVRSGWPTNAEAGEAEVVSMGDGSVVRARVLGTPPRVTVAHEVEGAAEASANDISGE
jgi:hypothetical protein